MGRVFRLVFGLALALPAAPALADDVQSDVSSREIAIESNFNGASVVIFGTIVRGPSASPSLKPYDIVAVVRGPKETVVARRKSRVAGIWINATSRTFPGLPSYYAVLSTRPLAAIVPDATARKYQIGFDALKFLVSGGGAQPVETGDPFRRSVIRLKARRGLYRASTDGITFVGDNLFRGTLELPSSVAVGTYDVEVYLFRDGELVSRTVSNLAIEKQGLESLLYSAAFDTPALYGIVAVIIAFAAGLIAATVFRRD